MEQGQSAASVFIGALLWTVSGVSSGQFHYHSSAQHVNLVQVVTLRNPYKIIFLENCISCGTQCISNMLLYLHPFSWIILYFFFPWPGIRNQNLLESNLLLASVIMNWISAIQYLNKFLKLQCKRRQVVPNWIIS